MLDDSLVPLLAASSPAPGSDAELSSSEVRLVSVITEIKGVERSRVIVIVNLYFGHMSTVADRSSTRSVSIV